MFYQFRLYVFGKYQLAIAFRQCEDQSKTILWMEVYLFDGRPLTVRQRHNFVLLFVGRLFFVIVRSVLDVVFYYNFTDFLKNPFCLLNNVLKTLWARYGWSSLDKRLSSNLGLCKDYVCGAFVKIHNERPCGRTCWSSRSCNVDILVAQWSSVACFTFSAFFSEVSCIPPGT